MLSGYDDAYRTFSNNVAAPWVDGKTVKVDENIMKWVDQTKTFTDKGYNNKTSLWDDAWAKDQGQKERYSDSSIQHGESTSHFLATPLQILTERKKSEMVSMVITQYARDRNHITGAEHGSVQQQEQTTKTKLLIS